MGIFKGKDPLWNGTVIGALAGLAAAYVPQIQDAVMGWIAFLPDSIEKPVTIAITFAGIGALIGLVSDWK